MFIKTDEPTNFICSMFSHSRINGIKYNYFHVHNNMYDECFVNLPISCFSITPIIIINYRLHRFSLKVTHIFSTLHKLNFMLSTLLILGNLIIFNFFLVFKNVIQITLFNRNKRRNAQTKSTM